jgi:predicted transcriptional regulator
VSEPEFYLIQTAVSDELARALKAHAALTKVFLADVFVEAIERFIDHVHALHSKGHGVPYLSSSKASTMMNMRIPMRLARRLQVLAQKEDIPVRRFAYTALVNFAVDNQLMPPLGTVQSGVPVDQEDPSLVELVRGVRRKKRQKTP